MFPDRVGPEEKAALVQRAAAVEADLRFVGLPVVQGGDCVDGTDTSSSTFVVFYDSSADESGGVYVHWSSGAEITRLVITSPELAAQRAVPLGGAALEAMTDAVERILTAAGWRVDRNAVGEHESSVKVLDPGTAASPAKSA